MIAITSPGKIRLSKKEDKKKTLNKKH